MQNKKDVIFCVDIGGTKTAFACFDTQGNELFYDCFPTNPKEGAARLVERVFERAKPHVSDVKTGVIASPGPLDVKLGKIVNVTTMGWTNVPIVRLFEEKFGISFRLLNDCDAGGLGVWKFGGYSEANTLCYVSVSTGIGGGIVANGRLLTGKGNAAEFGHIPVPGEGLKCGCGGVDCLELYASDSGLEARYLQKTGKGLSCLEIERLARSGDTLACGLFKEAGEKLAFALAAVKSVLDPDIVVLGGSVCKAKDLFMPVVEKRLPTLCIEYAKSGKQVLLGALAYGLR